MTLPQTGSFSLIDVRDKCLRDTGNIQLTSNRTRDFFRLKTGSIKLSDARPIAWSAGRDLVSQSPASSVRPYHCAYGTDGGGSKTRSVNSSGARILWSPKVSGTSSSPGASYMDSFFYADSGHNDFRLRYKFLKVSPELGGGTINLKAQVIAFRDGFLSGPSESLYAMNNTANSATRTGYFTVPSDKRFVLVSFAAWMSGGTSQNSDWNVELMEVDHS